MLSIVVFLMWMFGGYTIMDINYSYIHVIGLMFISFFAQATIEELTFRGLFFRKLEN
jgi:membrane protease YdiL (CAAX protease family)